MNALISICVPVYNVAPYIERCMHSLMQQTYKNIEYIFVDDCSTDNSIALLQAVAYGYPERQSAVRVLRNDRNHGLAYTRRVSIQAAKGDYVLCVDSDDYIEPDTVQQLYEAVNSPDCDIVIGAYVCEKGEERQIVKFSFLTEYDSLFPALIENRIGNIWGNLIRRSLFSQPSVRFAPDGQDYMEDRTAMLYLTDAARGFNVIDVPLYHYVQHKDSISNNKTDKHFRGLICYWELADEYLAQHGLTEQYRAITDREKLTDKVHLLHFCKDVSVCQRYANLYAEAEAHQPTLQLSGGKRLTRFLTNHHLWLIMHLYKWYMELRS